MEHSYSGYNILIVDDEEEIRSVLKGVISSEFKSQIFTADSGYKALKIINNEKIDLTILDIKMPEMDGIQLLKRICARSPETINLILTGFADKNHFIDAFRYHVYDFLEKPCTRGVFVNRVRRALCYLSYKNMLSMAVKEFLIQSLENFDPDKFERASYQEKQRIIRMGLSIISTKNLKKVINEK